MRGQPTSYFTPVMCVHTCVSNVTAKVILLRAPRWKCNGREMPPVGWHCKMKAPYIKELMYRMGIIASRDCIWAADIWSYAGTRVFYSLSVSPLQLPAMTCHASLCQPQEPCSSSQPIKGSYPLLDERVANWVLSTSAVCHQSLSVLAYFSEKKVILLKVVHCILIILHNRTPVVFAYTSLLGAMQINNSEENIRNNNTHYDMVQYNNNYRLQFKKLLWELRFWSELPGQIP